MNQLTEYYKILQRFSSLYAGEGDDELARHAADAITPLADKGSDKAAEALANLYRYDFADDEMIDAQAKKDFTHKWHYRWIEILEAKAAKGVASAAQALMKLYRQIASRRNLYGKYNHEVSVAQHEIGNMYMKGLGVETDIRQAFDWIRLAAENGNIAAENALNNKKFRDFKR